MVGTPGLEPGRLIQPTDFKSVVFTNFTMPQRRWHAIYCAALFRATLALTLPYSLASCKFVFASFDVNFIFFDIFCPDNNSNRRKQRGRLLGGAGQTGYRQVCRRANRRVASSNPANWVASGTILSAFDRFCDCVRQHGWQTKRKCTASINRASISLALAQISLERGNHIANAIQGRHAINRQVAILRQARGIAREHIVYQRRMLERIAISPLCPGHSARHPCQPRHALDFYIRGLGIRSQPALEQHTLPCPGWVREGLTAEAEVFEGDICYKRFLILVICNVASLG